MENKWKDLSKMIVYSSGGIMSKVVQKDEFSDVTLFCMSKDTEISTHTSTRCGYVYVLEGDGIFTLVKEEIQMKAGVLISMDANAKHSIIAKENTTFILMLKSPPKTKV